jgi:hypothetical protein
MPNLKSFDEQNVQFGWDQTSIKLAEECLKKYEYVMLKGWRSRGSNVHLLFGGVYASCLEHFHKFRAEGVEHDQALINVVREALVSTWVYNEEEPDKSGPWISDHNTKTRENLVRTIVWYFEHFKDDPCQTIILSNGRPAVEHSCKVNADDGIILSAHIDRVVEYANNPYIQDQKTTGATISSYYFNSYNPDSQITGTLPFVGRAVFGIPIKGVMVDAAQIAVGFSRFERGFVFVDDPILDEWYDDTMELIGRAQAATRNNHFPRNRASCHKYAGCQFRNVCSKSPHVREQFLKADFEKGVRWDPLEAR